MKVRALVTRTFNDVMAFSYDVLHGRGFIGTMSQDVFLLFLMYVSVSDSTQNGVTSLIYLAVLPMLVLGMIHGIGDAMLVEKFEVRFLNRPDVDRIIRSYIERYMHDHNLSEITCPPDLKKRMAERTLSASDIIPWLAASNVLRIGARTGILMTQLSAMVKVPETAAHDFVFSICALSAIMALVGACDYVARRKLTRCIEDYVYRNVLRAAR